MNRHKSILRGVSAAALGFGLAAASAWAGDTITYAPAAAWVKPVEPARPDDKLSGAPVQVLLEDSQTYFSADGDATYTEIVMKVQNAQGLAAAQPYAVWNPGTSDIVVHKVTLIRGDQVIDLLKAGQTFTVVRRETNLERSIIDGLLTGVLQPEGLQVGDVLDYALTIKRHDPAFGGNSEALNSVTAPAKVGRVTMRAVWGKDKPMRYRQGDGLSKGKLVTTDDGGSEYTLDMTNVTQPETPSEAPDRFGYPPTVEFSQFASWQDISRLMAPLYAKAAQLPPDSPLLDEVAKIRAASSDPKAQAAAALKLVESEVRYLYLDMNQGGYVPAEAGVTWSRRFGDCKGKATLLLALLNQLGIEAVPALVNSAAGDGMDAHLPMIQLFDHVIVRATIDGKTYWMDPTRVGDRDLDSLAVPHLHWALPATDAGADLEALKPAPFDTPQDDTVVRIDASGGFDSPVKFHAERIWRGDAAVGFDIAMKAATPGDRDKGMRAFWSGQYPGLDVRKVSADFDPATGEEKLVVDGMLKLAFQADATGKVKGWRYVPQVDAIGWDSGVDRASGPHRDAPVAIGFPVYTRSRQEIILPKQGKGFTVDAEPFDKTIGGAELHRAVAIRDGVFTIETSKRSLTDEIPYDEASRAAKTLTRLYNDDVHLVTPDAFRIGGKTAIASLGKKGEKTADQLVVDGATFSSQGDDDKAMESFNAALKLDPANAKALAGRGFILLVKKQKTEAGITDLEQAVKSDPAMWTAWNALGSAYMMTGRTADAIGAYSKALDAYPNDTWALGGRAEAYLANGDADKARADAQATLDLEPSNTGALGIMATLALRDQHNDDAAALIDKALEADPDNRTLLYEKAAVLAACAGASDACKASRTEAIAVYDKLIGQAPDAYNYARRAQLRRDTDHAGALADLDAALAIDPKSVMALETRAWIYMDDKAYDKVRDDLDLAVAAAPKDASVHTMRADLFFHIGKQDMALSEIDAAIDLDEDKANGLNSACWSRATHNAQLDKALAQCNEAINLEPKRASYLDSRGFVELRMGKYDEAIADYDTAVRLVPNIAPSLYGRGIAKLRKGMKAEGEADLAAARGVNADIDKEFTDYGVTP